MEPLRALAEQLRELKRHGPGALSAYLRNTRLSLLAQTRQVFMEARK
jgi:hypothetical protein